MANFGNVLFRNEVKKDKGPKGIHLTPEDTGSEGIEVIGILGSQKKPNDEIDWYIDMEMLVKVRVDDKTGNPLIEYQHISDYEEPAFIHTIYDADSNTWWRKRKEADIYEEDSLVCLRIIEKKAANRVQGIELTPEDTGPDGIKVIAMIGECFGSIIKWCYEAELWVKVRINPVTNLPILDYKYTQYLEDDACQKHGFETATKTWWRYEDEVDPTVYREHCLRILRRV